MCLSRPATSVIAEDGRHDGLRHIPAAGDFIFLSRITSYGVSYTVSHSVRASRTRTGRVSFAYGTRLVRVRDASRTRTGRSCSPTTTTTTLLHPISGTPQTTNSVTQQRSPITKNITQSGAKSVMHLLERMRRRRDAAASTSSSANNNNVTTSTTTW